VTAPASASRVVDFRYAPRMPSRETSGVFIAELPDEPALSDALAALIDRVKLGQSLREGAAPEPADTPSVVLDFSSVTYINSSHIAAVLRLRKMLIDRRRRIVLCSLSDELYSVLMLTGLERVLHCAPDQKSAAAIVRVEMQQEG
jgi:anti-anti-sigma factor